MEPLTRKYFGTDGIRARVNHYPLVPEFITRLGQAAALTFLSRRSEESRTWPVVIVGKDTRQSSDMLESAIAAGLASCGIDVRLAGVVPTPAISQLTREEEALCGIVISASHNPFDDNGIKFFGPDGYKLDDSLEQEIEALIDQKETKNEGGPVGRIATLEHAAERYISLIRASVGEDRELFRGLHIALDTANGASFETSTEILRSLGAKVSVFHHHPSGININLDCGCTHPSEIASLVKQTGADVGIALDGDADRVLLCDETGTPLDGDESMAIAALAMIEAGTLRQKTLVATVMSNAGLDEAIRAAGGQVLRAGVGDRYVAQLMREQDCNLGGEQSGHFIFRDYNRTGDGILAAVQILRIMQERAQPLSELRRVMTKLPQAQRNLRVKAKPPLSELAAAPKIAALEKELDDSGRVLLRYSGTEALLRLLVEGRDAQWIEQASDEIIESIRTEIGA